MTCVNAPVGFQMPLPPASGGLAGIVVWPVVGEAVAVRGGAAAVPAVSSDGVDHQPRRCGRRVESAATGTGRG